MNQTALRRRTLPILFAALATGSVYIANPVLAATATAKKVTYKGPTVDDRFGAAKVSIVVEKKKIINVKANANPDTPRSQHIDQDALPILKNEVLKAQSAKIQPVSGATITSQAYISSLKSAVSKAKKAKAL